MENKPEWSKKVGGISLACWKGEHGLSYTLRKQFKNKAGEWVDSKSFFPEELSVVLGLIMPVLMESLMRPQEPTQQPEAAPAQQGYLKGNDDIPF